MATNSVTKSDLSKWLQAFEDRAKGIENAYLTKIGQHLRRIGTLIPSEVNTLAEMRRLDANLNEIRSALARESNKSVFDVNVMLLNLAITDYASAAQLLGISDPPPISHNEELMQLVKAQARVTGGSMRNLSQTTIESTLYRRAVDTAVQSVQMGTTDYNSAIRMAATRIAQNGLVVTYPTGYHRRLDSAVRQNILDGARALSQAVLDGVGEEFNANGVEITAHAMCAPDHLPYQGRQYTMAQYNQLQQALSSSGDGHNRPIGIWNCRHIARPIIIGVSKPSYTKEMLSQYAANSNKVVDIGGKSMTRYAWTQEQRKCETEIRRQRDRITLAAAQGDDKAVNDAKSAIKALQERYMEISRGAELEPKLERSTSRIQMSIGGGNNVPQLR